MFVCVCVCEREREGKRGKERGIDVSMVFFGKFLPCAGLYKRVKLRTSLQA